MNMYKAERVWGEMGSRAIRKAELGRHGAELVDPGFTRGRYPRSIGAVLGDIQHPRPSTQLRVGVAARITQIVRVMHHRLRRRPP